MALSQDGDGVCSVQHYSELDCQRAAQIEASWTQRKYQTSNITSNLRVSKRMLKGKQCSICMDFEDEKFWEASTEFALGACHKIQGEDRCF